MTLADQDRIFRVRHCCHVIVERLLEILFDLDNLRGSGRLYLSWPLGALAHPLPGWRRPGDGQPKVRCVTLDTPVKVLTSLEFTL